MGVVKERGEIPTNYKVSSDTECLAPVKVVDPTTVCTMASSSAIESLTTDLDDFSVEPPSNAFTSTTAAEDNRPLSPS